MAKLMKSPAELGDMIEGDAVEKSVQPEKTHLSAKQAGFIFVTAVAAFILALIALGLASFVVWQKSQQGAISLQPPSEATEQQFAALKSKIEANEKNQQQAITALNQLLDQQATTKAIYSADDGQVVTAGMGQRFAALEEAVKDLAAAAKVGSLDNADGIVNKEARSNFSITPDQVSLLIVSGLLADNMAGASLDRWIILLQELADQGSAIPDLAQFRMAAIPTPERPLYLIQTAYDLLPQMTAGLSRVTNDAGFLEKTRAKLGQLVQLREIGEGADGNEAALSAFEAALVIQDLDGAIRAAGLWSGSDVPLLTQWIRAAQSRQSLDRAVSALVTNRLAYAIAVQF